MAGSLTDDHVNDDNNNGCKATNLGQEIIIISCLGIKRSSWSFISSNILFSVRTNECDFFENNKEDHNCEGRVIETRSVLSEIQCADVCLRLHLCDRYIFHRQGKRAECKLLSTALKPRMSSNGNQNNPNRVCKTMCLDNGKVSRIEVVSKLVHFY